MIKKKYLSMFILVATIAAVVGMISFTMRPTAKDRVLTVVLEPKSNSGASGEVMFLERQDTVFFTATLQGLSPGMHAIHIHEKADCSSENGSSAGGHWNPTLTYHGKWGSANGYHKGDIGNFMVDSVGNGKVSFVTDEWCIGCDDNTRNIIGKSIIVHQGEDDFVSQPSGNAGVRIACGGLIE